MPDSRIPKQCYKMLKSLDEIGRINWATKVKYFGIVWFAQEIGDDDLFIKQFKLRISDCTLQDIQERISNSSRCDFYKNKRFLLDHRAIPFFDISPSLRKTLSRFRCSSHKFNVERGRQFNKERGNRLCTFCLKFSNDIEIDENEYHAFFSG